MITTIEIENRKVSFYTDETPEYVLIQPVDASDESVLENQLKEIKRRTDKKIMLAAFNISDWNGELSPWDAPAVFGDAKFGHGAKDTLLYITDKLIPSLKEKYSLSDAKFVIGGYSLAGLFSLWAGYECDLFSGVRAASPSVWFVDWDKYIAENPLKTSVVYLSLGDKEEKTKNPTMKQVGDRIRMMNEKYNSLLGENTTLEMNQGNHFKETDIRTAKAFSWVVNRL